MPAETFHAMSREVGGRRLDCLFQDPEAAWCLKQAAGIAGRIREHALLCRQSSITWLVPVQPEAGSEPVPLGPHVYDGTCGIALFLSAFHSVHGGSTYRELALCALAPLRRKLADLVNDPQAAARLRLALGGLVGLGSFLYTFIRTGHWLGEPALIDEAHDASVLLTSERIAEDERLDITNGCAGTLLALLALHRLKPETNPSGATPLELAAACARRLLTRRVSFNGSPRAWASGESPPLSGFGHGAAGIAHALLRLYEETGRGELLEAAQEGFAFERSLYDYKARNWLDLRFGRLLEQSAWCHGAPGIALARLAAIGVYNDLEVGDEIQELLATIRALPDTPIDHLCCGNMGRAEILLVASQILEDSELFSDSCGLAQRVVRRAQTRGDFGLLPPGKEPVFVPSLFRGLAGIGYTLLRLAHPRELPCLLLMA